MNVSIVVLGNADMKQGSASHFAPRIWLGLGWEINMKDFVARIQSNISWKKRN